MPRSTKIFKKRTFYGKHKDKLLDARLTSSTSKHRPSTSSEKLSVSVNSYREFKSDTSEYTVVNLDTLENSLNEVAYCKKCKSPLKFTKINRVGLACEIAVSCTVCENNTSFNNCNSVVCEVEGKRHNLFDLNLRLTLGLRVIGKGKVAADKLCAVLNLGSPYSRYHLHERYLTVCAETICKESMQRAVLDTVEKNNLSSDIAVAVDGSWQRRGHQSLNGVVSVTSLLTGKLLDVEILSKYCECKDKLNDNHNNTCLANFRGSSGAMEVTGAINIFKRSSNLYAVRYLEYLGDGDSKAHPAVCESRPYGNTNITKIECIGHVQKRMGRRLKALKLRTKTLPDEELPETEVTTLAGRPKGNSVSLCEKTKTVEGHLQWDLGETSKGEPKKATAGTKRKPTAKDKKPKPKTLGGRGRLTEEAILQIQKYYGLAIRRNHTSVESMKQAIWAEFFHIVSSNENPNHGLCPKDDDTWCKYHIAVKNKEVYDHNKHFHLPSDVMNFIKPIFKDLSDPSLLEKCVKGKTQNPNESLNNVIWSFIPKVIFVRLNTLRFGVYMAISNFNDGNITTCRIFEKCGLKAGKYLVRAMERLDRRRIMKAEKAQQDLEKKARQHKSLLKRKLDDLFEEEEGDEPSYAPGMY